MARNSNFREIMTIDFRGNISQISSVISTLQKQLSQLGLPEKSFNNFDKRLNNLANDLTKLQSKAESGFQTPNELNKFILDIQRLSHGLDQIGSDFGNMKFNTSSIQHMSKEFQNAEIQANLANEQLNEYLKSLVKLKKSKPSFEIANPKATTEKGQKFVREANISLSTIERAAAGGATSADLNRLINQEFGRLSQTSHSTKGYNDTIGLFRTQLAALRDYYSGATALADNYDKKYAEQQAIGAQVVNNFQNQTKQMDAAAKAGAQYANSAGGIAASNQEVYNTMSAASDQMGQLSSRLKSLTSGYVIFQQVLRLVRQSFQEFYELDKQFNEISIVTGNSMEEMWNDFSRVNKIAQEYGVTTKDVLEVQNLYYHQGLSNAEVNRITAETLTLAKISGLEFADATDKMTATMNAFRIASEDVGTITDTFASLDAAAAVDVKELANAMTKTASIAANAGMDIQTTSTFLTQMIEVTRESSENLGTALKTIIARFTELKEQVDVDADGEIADFNRVDTALKAAGVSLVDSAGQFRDIDDVFFDLSKTWTTLDRNTQRYIATQAAGSRQQSRFIAMIEDYDRLMELLGIAQDSAGIGALHLARAQESIETAINRLKSTWQEFYSNFISSDFFKNVINVANELLTNINDGNTLLKTAAALTAALIVKKTAEYVIDKARLNLMREENNELGRMLTQREMLSKSPILQTAGRKVTGGLRKKFGQSFEIPTDTFIENAATGRRTSVMQQTGGGLFANLVGKGYANITKSGKAPLLVSQNTMSSLGANFQEGYKSLGLIQKVIVAINGVLGTTVASTVGWVAAAAALPAIIVGIYQGVVKLQNKWFNEDAEQAVKDLNEATSDYKDTLNELRDITSDYNTYQELIERGAALTAEEQEELTNIQNELASIAPEMVDYYDAEGNAILKTTDELEKLIDARQEDLSLQRDQLNLQSRSAVKYGIFNEESEAGTTFSNMVDLASGLDIATMQKNKGWGLSKDDIKEGIESLGQATAFNRITFGNITGDELTQNQWERIVDTIQNQVGDRDISELDQSEINDIFAHALDKSNEYGQAKIDHLVEINELLSNTLIDTFVDMADYVKEAAISQAKTDISKAQTTNAPELTELTTIFTRLIENNQGFFAAEGFSGIDFRASTLVERDTRNERIQHSVATTNGMQDYWSGEGGYATYHLLTGNNADVQTVYEDVILQTEDVVDYLNSRIEEYTDESTGEIDFEGLADEIEHAKIDYDDENSKYIEAIQNAADDLGYSVQELLESGSIDALSESYQEVVNQLGEQLLGDSATDVNALLQQLSGAEGANKEILDEIEKILTANNVGVEGFLGDEGYINQYINELEKDYNEVVDQINTTITQQKLGFEFDPEGKTEEQVRNFRDNLVQILSDAGRTAGANWGESFNDLTYKLSPKMLQQLYALDWSDAMGLARFQAQLEKTYGEGSIQVELFTDAIENSGDLSKKALDTGAEALEELSEKVENLTNDAEYLTSALSGELGFEDMLQLVQDIGDESTLSIKDFTVTGQGFKLTAENAELAKNALLEAQRADAEHLVTMYKSEIANKRETQAVQKNLAAKLTLKRATEGLTTAEEVALANAEQQINSLDTEVQSLIEQAEETEQMINAWEAMTAYIDQMFELQQLEATADELEEIYDRLESIASLIEDLDIWENIDNLKDILDFQLDEYSGTIDLNLNAELNSKAIQGQVRTLTQQIATARGTRTAANREIDYWARQIQNSQYLSIGADGNLIKNQSYYDLATSARNATSDIEVERIKAQLEQIDQIGEKYTEAYERAQEATQEEIDTLEKLQDIQKETISQMSDLSETLLNIMIDNDNEELENYQTTIDKKKEALEDYLDAVQDSINRERDMRDLADQEEELRQKERQLSILQMDTSGLYAADIASLQDEIASDRRNLEDSYVDQYVTNLSDEITKQSEAYENDILAWEEYLEWKKEDMILYQDEIDSIISQGTDAITTYITTKSLEIQGMTTQQLENFKVQTADTVNTAMGYYMALTQDGVMETFNAINLARNETGSLQDVTDTFANEAISDYDGVAGSIQIVSDRISDLVTNISANLTGAWREAKQAANDYWAAALNAENARNNGIEIPDLGGNTYNTTVPDALNPVGTSNQNSINKYTGLKDYYAGSSNVGSAVDENGNIIQEKDKVALAPYDSSKYKGTVSRIISRDGKIYIAFKGYENAFYYASKSGNVDKYKELLRELKSDSIKLTDKGWSAYASGGYVDYTGPAWVDGTPTKPEAFLNSNDTKRMEALIGVLQQLDTKGSLNSINKNNTQTNNNTFSITINVDELGDSYDVDQLAEDIQDIIYKNMTKGSVAFA